MLLSLEILSEQMRKLPGVGAKTALKYALALLEMGESEAEAFVSSIENARQSIRRCEHCFNLCEGMICSVCADGNRSDAQIWQPAAVVHLICIIRHLLQGRNRQ